MRDVLEPRHGGGGARSRGGALLLRRTRPQRPERGALRAQALHREVPGRRVEAHTEVHVVVLLAGELPRGRRQPRGDVGAALHPRRRQAPDDAARAVPRGVRRRGEGRRQGGQDLQEGLTQPSLSN